MLTLNLLFILFFIINNIECGLTVEKLCGQIKCKAKEYCSEYGKICLPCDNICDVNSHNYHREECDKSCQDYLHEQYFMLRSESADLKDDIKTLTVVAWLSLVLSALTLMIMFCICTHKVNRARKRKGGMKALIKTIFPPLKLHKDTEKVKVDINSLKIDIPPSIPTNQPSSPNTASTISTKISFKQRSPSEDATLDNYAYDNPGLAPSPTHLPHSRETNF